MIKSKKIIYFGSPAFSAEILSSLLPNIVGVVTNPDRPTPTPVAQLALDNHLPVFKPEKLDDANLAHLKLLKPDFFLVVSYGKFFPPSWLTMPTLNIHFSLLPKYRGALCIQEAIKNQDQETGVTLMCMAEKMDAGPIIAQSKVNIDINDNVATLTTRLTQSAINLLSKFSILNTKFSIPQDDSQASYTPSHKTLNHANAFIDFEIVKAALNGTNAAKIHALIRSLNPEPGAWTRIGNLEVKITKTTLNSRFLILDSIQLPGKSPTSWQQFLAGHSSTAYT